jgi:hypothetical protein
MKLPKIALALEACAASLMVGACVARTITGEDEGIAEVGGDDDDDIGDDVADDDGMDDGVDDGPVPICPQVQLGPEVPVAISIDTTAQSDDFVASCEDQAGPSPDFEVAWTAPVDGRYVAYTSGSTFDPLLMVLDGGCDGIELACNDDAGELESAVQFDAFAGQPFTFVVGAFSSEVGTSTLAIEAVDVAVCPDAVLGARLPFMIGDDSTTAPDRGGGSCGGAGGPDRRYTFAAPSDGLYGFELFADFDGVIDVHEGECTFVELACNDDLLGISSPGLGVPLAAGQLVTLGVDSNSGAGGPFVLSGDRLVPEECPGLFLGSSAPVASGGFTFDGVNSAGSACGGWASPDLTYQWTAPETGAYRVAVDESDFDWVLSVFDGDCAGPMLACRNALEAGGSSGAVVVEVVAGQTLTIAVDGLAASTGFFDMSVDRFEGCDAIALPEDPPVSIINSTVGEPAENAGSCAPTDDSPEATYLFVPPVTGPYRIHTEGSSYDTVIYVRAGECLGPEIACSDDVEIDTWSEVTLELLAGQPVYVFVDGYGGDSGPYQLTIEPA